MTSSYILSALSHVAVSSGYAVIINANFLPASVIQNAGLRTYAVRSAHLSDSWVFCLTLHANN